MRRILVIRLSSLGDVVLTLPVFKRLREAHPDAYIAALVKESFADVLRGDPAISEVITLGRQEPIASLLHRVRAAQFDTVLDLHSNVRSRLVSLAAGATRVVRYQKAALARRLYVGWRFGSDQLKSHTLDRYLDALATLERSPQVLLTRTPERLLLIQTAFLGDAVLTTPLLGAIQKQFPKTPLTVLCTPDIVDVFERHPAVSDVIVFDKRGKEKSLRAQWQLIQALQKRHFDLALIPHRSLKSALIAWLAGIPRRVGFSTSQGRWLLTDVVPFQWGVHDADRNLALLQAFGVRNPSGDLWLKPTAEAQATVVAKLAEAGVGPKDVLVGINAGSVWATKRWLPEGFAAVADRLLREKQVKVVFIGGPKDVPVMNQVLSQMKECPLNWVGQTNLKELIAVVGRCQAFLTNDSGPLHIAVASHVPTVAIFGPTTKELGFFPYGSGHRVIEKNLECRPCGLHGADACPLGHFKCMKDISAEEVYAAVEAQLLAPSPVGVQ